MCIEFMGLNKTCPMNSYLMLSIDKLVDNAFDYLYLCFMDVYSGYNQIRMDPRDKDKTTFVIKEVNSIAK